MARQRPRADGLAFGDVPFDERLQQVLGAGIEQVGAVRDGTMAAAALV
jgi:hypothetical protein